MGHMPRGSENAHGHSRSTLRWMAWSVVLLVTGVVTTPIFQAGHNIHLPLGRPAVHSEAREVMPLLPLGRKPPGPLYSDRYSDRCAAWRLLPVSGSSRKKSCAPL